MIGTQSRLPYRAVQLGEAVLLKNPVSPFEISEIIGEPSVEGRAKQKNRGSAAPNLFIVYSLLPILTG
jgi:hypothetical protein